MKKENNIESLFKDAFDAYEVDPGASAWSSVQSGIQAGASNAASVGSTISASSGGVASTITTAIVALGIGAIAIGGYFYFDNQGKSKELLKEKPVITIPEAANSSELLSDEEGIEKTETEPSVKEKLSIEAPEKAAEKVEIENKKREAVVEELKSTNKAVNTNSSIENESKVSSKDDPSKDISSKDNTNVASTTQSETTSSKHLETQESTSAPESKVEESSSSKEAINTEPLPPINEPTEKEENPLATEIFEKVGNIFSPNQDGINDIFMIQADGADRIEVKVYSRTQRLIHEWNNPYGFWDGTMPDKTMAPEGIYFYTLLIEIDGEPFMKKGSLTLSK